MNLNFDVWSVFALLLVCGIVFWGLRILKQRLDEQRYQEQLAELEFTERLINQTTIEGSGNDSAFLQETPAPVRASEPEAPKAVAPGPVSPSTMVAAEVAAAPVMKQLTQSGIVTGSVEGHVELHGNPRGAAILRLRSGKLALLVPHMESEAFYRQQARRVDIIIVAGTDGRAIVITPLEQMISENLLTR